MTATDVTGVGTAVVDVPVVSGGGAAVGDNCPGWAAAAATVAAGVGTAVADVLVGGGGTPVGGNCPGWAAAVSVWT